MVYCACVLLVIWSVVGALIGFPALDPVFDPASIKEFKYKPIKILFVSFVSGPFVWGFYGVCFIILGVFMIVFYIVEIFKRLSVIAKKTYHVDTITEWMKK